MSRVRKRLFPRLALAFSLMALAGAPLRAQSGSVQGVVRDQSGAVAGGVRVVVTSQDTGTKTTVLTNDAGLYSVPFLSPGTYRVEASKPGFTTSLVENLKIDVQQAARVDITLRLESVNQSVEVSASGTLLESETTTMGQVIENKRIVEMPLNSRNYLDLARLSAGVLPAATLGVGARTGQTESGFVAMGTRAYQTNILVDGVDNSSRAGGGPLGFQAQATKPSVDAVGEFKVITNNFSAEYGFRVGAKVLVSIKSGTNGLHGSLFEFLRNNQFDGTNFFANRSGSRKPTLRQNQFGGTAGGPVIRNRTFFFASYQGTRIRQGKSFLSTVPSLEARNGDFSLERTNYNQIYDPLTTTGAGTAATRQPFPNFTIPKSRFDPVSTAVLQLYPLPNIAARAHDVNNYFRSPSDSDNSNQVDFKIDHNFSDNDRVFYRHSIRRQSVLNNSPLPTEAGGGDGGQAVELNGNNLAFGWTHTFNPRAFSETRFGFTHFPTRFDTLLQTPLNAQYGIKGAPGDTFDDNLKQGFSAFSISGFATLGTPCCWPNINKMDNLHITHNVVLLRGAHTIKFGGELRRLDIYRQANRFRRGAFTFNKLYTAQQPNVASSRSATGNPLAEMILGWAQTTTIGNQNGENAIAPYYGGYVQDDWKITSRLTLNLGLRWEFFQGPYFPGGTSAGFPGVSNFLTEYQGVGPGDPRYHTFARPRNDRDCGCQQDYNNFAPRLGVAYQLTPRTVVRASGGIFYGEPDIVTTDGSSWAQNTPQFTEVTTNGTNLAPATLVAAGFPVVTFPTTTPIPGSSVATMYTRRTNQYISQWFLDIQHELPASIIVSAGYQGTKGSKLPVNRNINNGGPDPSIPEAQRRVLPQWSSVSLGGEPMANSSYNALVARAEKRFAKGLTFLASYTWAHNIDNATEFLDSNFGSLENPYDLRRERASSNLDQRHVFVASYTYELPVGHGKAFGSSWRGPVDAVLGGWQLGGIVTLRTGLPFDVSYPGDPQNSGTLNRGDRVASGKVANPTIDRWFDQYAFVQSAPGVYGNTGRNVLYGPGTRNFDFILAKQFVLPWEGHRAQFRFESFNFTNTPKFGQPSGALRAPATATISQADDPRRIQFGLKYVF